MILLREIPHECNTQYSVIVHKNTVLCLCNQWAKQIIFVKGFHRLLEGRGGREENLKTEQVFVLELSVGGSQSGWRGWARKEICVSHLDVTMSVQMETS